MANTIKIDLEADVKDAIQSIEQFARSADSQLAGVAKAFGSLGAIALGAFAGFSLKSVIEASIESEKAIVGLKAALNLSGKAADAAVKDFSDFAEEIQNLTGVSDEAVLGQVAFLKQLGATDTQAKKVITTGTNLSAALGTDLSGAVTQLAQTFSGTVSRSLTKLLPELNNLTEAQLRNGAAVDLLAKKYPDAAKEISGSLFVQLKVLTETAGNLAEAIGDLITQNSFFREGISLSIQTIQALISIVKGDPLKPLALGIRDAGIAIISLISAFALIKTIPVSIAVVTASVELLSINIGLLSARVGLMNALKTAFISLAASIDVAKIALNLFKAAATIGLTLFLDVLITSIAETKSLSDGLELVIKKLKLFGLEVLNILSFKSFDFLKKGVEEARKQVDALKTDPIRKLAKDTDDAGDSAEGLGKKFKKTAQQILDEFNNLNKTVSKDLLNPVEKIASEEKEKLKIIQEALDRRVISAELAAEAEGKVRLDSFKKTQEQIQKIQNQAQGLLAESIKNPFGSAEFSKLKDEFIKNGATQADLEKLNVTVTIGKSFGFLKNAFDGAKGAVEAVSKGIGFIANTLLPGIGEIVSQIVTLLAQGPEFVKKQISEFLKEIPKIINSIITSVPAILEAVISSISTVISSLLLGLSDSIAILFDHVGALVIQVFETLPAILDNLLVGLANGIFQLLDRIPDILVSLADRLTAAMTNFFEVGIPQFIQKLIDESPRVITQLVTESPRIIAALVAAAPQLIVALETQMPFLAVTLAIELVKNIPTIVDAFKQEFLKIPEEFAGFLREAVQKVLGSLGNIGDKVGGLFKGLGFAEGGQVPAGFPNDSFPARLTSGEAVIDRSDNERLSRFLDAQERGQTSSNQPVVINLQIGEAQLAKVLLNLNRQGFRIAP